VKLTAAEKKLLQIHVQSSLSEDYVKKDVTSNLLNTEEISAVIIFKEAGVLCGIDWINEVFKKVNSKIKIKWLYKDGSFIKKNKTVCIIKGDNKSILAAERSALNFLQTLSGISSNIKKYQDQIKNKNIKLLYTRKIVPGWKYAIDNICRLMHCKPHRYNLQESILIKENHLKFIKNIEAYIRAAKKSKKLVIAEAKTLSELKTFNNLKLNRILLDNFTPSQVKKAIKLSKNTPIEVSGNITIKNIKNYAIKGVSFISVGALTKNIHALNISLLVR